MQSPYPARNIHPRPVPPWWVTLITLIDLVRFSRRSWLGPRLSPPTWAALAVVLALWLAAAPLLAQSPDLTESPVDVGLNRGVDQPDAERYFCDYLEAEADAEGVVFLAPDMYAIAGGAESPSSDDGNDSLFSNITPRLTVGVRYYFADLRRRNLTYDRARAECESYRAESRLRIFLSVAHTVGLLEALAARDHVLVEALTEAGTMLDEAESRIERHEATVQAVYALRQQIDGLDARIASNALERSRMALQPELPEGNPWTALTAYLHAETQIQQAEHGLDRADNWEFEARVVYDQVFPDDDGGFPISGSLRATFDFGHLWQADPQRRAREAHQAWLTAEEYNYQERLLRLFESLSAQRADLVRRLAVLETLIVLIDEQVDRASQFENPATIEHLQRLWFDRVELRSEQAGMTSRIEAFDAFFERVPE